MGERRAENPLSHYLLPLTIPGAVHHNRCVEHSYVMLRYTEDTVLFDERFINYGCNKVQYVDHLRLQGYSFFIPSEVFSTDLVHREYGRAFTFTHSSSFRNRFVKSFGVKERPEMTLTCYSYLDDLRKEYRDEEHAVPVCPNVNAVTYSTQTY